MKLFFKILFTLIALYQAFIDLNGLFTGELIIPILTVFALLAMIGLWQRRYFGVFFMYGYFLFVFVDYTISFIGEWSKSAIIQWIIMIVVMVPMYFVLRDEYDPSRDSKFDKWILKYLLRSKAK